MKGRLIALDHVNGREAAALVVDGRLEDILVENDRPRIGRIYRAVADRPMKGQGGLFLRTPDGNAFLRQVKGISPGQTLLVQVTGHAEGGKAIPVTDRLLFKSRYAIVTPGAPGVNLSRAIRDEEARVEILEIAREALAEHPLPEGAGLILRSSCANADDAEIADDILAMVGLAQNVLSDPDRTPEVLVAGEAPHELAWREWTEPAIVDAEPGSFARHGIDDALDALRLPSVSLPAGASMRIEPTAALVAVDIDTGPDGSPAAGLKANMAAFRELPRQLRLRGLGGQIVLDPAPSPKKERRQLDQVLRAGFKRETTETVLVGWTAMGLVEVQRKRDRIPTREVLG